MSAAGEPQDRWGRGGRTMRWRAWMLAAGAAVGGYGAAVLWRPRVLIWTVGGACLLFAVALVAAAVLARGPRDG